MGKRRARGGRRGGDDAASPIPLAPVDLLAGLAPGVELVADDLPPGVVDSFAAVEDSPTVTVAEAGKLVRAGEGTIRRLIRGRVIAPATAEPPTSDDDVPRAGVLRRTPDKPGE